MRAHACSCVLQVAVLVPSYRVNPSILSGILKASNTSFADVDVR